MIVRLLDICAYLKIFSFMPRCLLYSRGFSLRSDRRPIGLKGGGRRGRLTGAVSSASFRRLREFCLTHDVVGRPLYGITLTVPGLDVISDDEFRKLHHTWLVWCNAHSLPVVWRVELQQRGMPHLHCVLYGPLSDVMRACWHWFRLLEKMPCVFSDIHVSSTEKDMCFVPRSWVDGACHAVEVQALSGDFSAWRYLITHMSKGKLSQSGWRGRNWGVATRALFEEIRPRSVALSDSQYYMVLRWLRRLTRRRVNVRCGCSSWVCNPDTVNRMISYVRSLPLDAPF